MDKPIVYVFISKKLREKSNSDLLDKRFLKEIVGRILRSTGGIPRFMIKYIIDDLVKFGILTYLNNNGIYRLNEVKEEKKLNFYE